MRIGELAQRAGATVKAVRYYEQIGLITPDREHNGYRTFGEHHVQAVQEIRKLAALGIAPARATPFLECLDAGHEHGDECVSSLAVYRDAIAEIDGVLAELTRRRNDLQTRLDASASSTFSDDPHEAKEPDVADYTILPDGLPVPDDDGAAAHLPGLPMPPLTLPTSDGERIRLDEPVAGRVVIYLYPLTGRPGVDLPEGWDAIPGARGCSTEACNFRDHFTELRDAGVTRVFGLSSQDADYQAEVVDRLRLPFPMLSDEAFALGDALHLPTFAAEGHDRLYSRLTLIVTNGVVEHVFYPIFPPNTHAQQVLAWLHENPRKDAE